MASRSAIVGRLSGKWQIPLLLASSAALVLVVLFGLPTAESVSAPRALTYLDDLLAAGEFDQAAEFAQRRLADQTRPEDELAETRLRLARARYEQARIQRIATPAVGAVIEHHYEPAMDLGLALTPDDYLRLADARAYQGDHGGTIAAYESALAAGVDNDAELHAKIYAIRKGKLLESPEALNRTLEQVLATADPGNARLRVWAVEEQLGLLLDSGEAASAPALLSRHRDSFIGTEAEDRLAYLEALVMYRTGELEPAERFLRALRNRLAPDSDVHAATGWLLGRVLLDLDRPAEAMTFFADVRMYFPATNYAMAAAIGQGEALALLGRHDEAAGAFSGAIAEMADRGESPIARRAPLRTTLMVLAERTRQEDHYDAAVQYGDLALELIDRGEVELATAILGQVGDLLAGYAGRLREAASGESDGPKAERLSTASRLHARRAAELYLDLARINSIDPSLTAQALWQAADLYDLAGQFPEAERLFDQYASEFPEAAFAPRAWARIGAIRQRMGRFEQAIVAFRACHARYPRTLDGARALLPLAECHRTLGDLDEAERVLRQVIADPVVFTPRAPEFAEAMYRLGDLLNQKGQYEPSITVLEEWWDRYAEDAAGASERMRALYLLADSYRHSGLALQTEAEDAAFSGQREQMLDDAKTRLLKAREHYGSLAELCRRVESGEQAELSEMYLRHAVLYEADCLFEMGMHRDALRLYEEAAGAWSDSTVALAAFVQIIACHLSLGSPHEARASLARAEVLVDRVPDAAFESSLSPERRDDWRRYFEWLGESELFTPAGS